MRGAGHPATLVGDLDTDPVMVPSLAKGLSDGRWVDLWRAHASGRGDDPAPACRFTPDERSGFQRDFARCAPVHFLLHRLALCCMIGVSPSTFEVLKAFSFCS